MIAASADIVLVVDGAGVIRGLTVNSEEPSRDLAGGERFARPRLDAAGHRDGGQPPQGRGLDARHGGAHGVITLNDLNSVEGHRRFGIRSLPVRSGPERAARVARAAVAAPRTVAAALPLSRGAPWQAGAALLLPLAQYALTARPPRDPRAPAPWHDATDVTPYALGMLFVHAFAPRPETAAGG